VAIVRDKLRRHRDDVENGGAKSEWQTLNGLEVRAAVVDYEGKPVKQRTVVVIPARRPELQPNRTMEVPVLLEGMSDKDARANIKMEITALKFKD